MTFPLTMDKVYKETNLVTTDFSKFIQMKY